MSKKAKLIVGLALFIAAAPLYLASNPGMERIAKGLWEKADDAQTPERVYWMIRFYNMTWRDDKGEALCKEWLRHYGGDESEKDVGKRFDSWDRAPDGRPTPENSFPYDDQNKRPPQKGEDFRPTPHPLTGRVLIIWGGRLEDGHQLQQAVHIYELLNDEKYCEQWAITREPEVQKAAISGVQRNGSGSRSF
jgi:hypothetical protein